MNDHPSTNDAFLPGQRVVIAYPTRHLSSQGKHATILQHRTMHETHDGFKFGYLVTVDGEKDKMLVVSQQELRPIQNSDAVMNEEETLP
jgi:hypothetical protein